MYGAALPPGFGGNDANKDVAASPVTNASSDQVQLANVTQLTNLAAHADPHGKDAEDGSKDRISSEQKEQRRDKQHEMAQDRQSVRTGMADTLQTTSSPLASSHPKAANRSLSPQRVSAGPSARKTDLTEDEHTSALVDEYNARYRNKPLKQVYEESHQSEKRRTTEKDHSERIFDWERDMNATVRRMSSKSANELLNRSKLDDRFGSSGTKKYL